MIVETGNVKSEKKSAHWIFNNSLLESKDFVQTIENVINENTKCEDNFFLNKFEQLKVIIKNIATRFGCKINRMRNKREQLLEKVILAFEKNKNKSIEYEKLKIEFENIQMHKYRGAYIRSKMPITQEKPTKAFLSLESSIQKNRRILQINGENGLLTNENDICNEFKSFYADLYSSEEADTQIQDYYLNFTRKLTNEQSTECGTRINLTDLKDALWSMNENATPGPNGLTVSFHKKFFEILAPYYERFLTFLYKGNNLTNYFKLSYITVLPKDSGSLLEIKNYRPISLLNIEYKMITKAIVNKISPYLETLIHPDQAACIKGRNIQKTNHYIRDIISLAKIRNDKAIILSIDQMKAYDRVSHTWLFKVLENSKIQENIINIIKLLYDGAHSKVLLNKRLTDSIELRRGCRQGDSLSGNLYILCLEPLLEKIRQDVSISGIHIPNRGCQKLLAFADDTNFFTNDIRSVEIILKNFDKFGKGSGSKINLDKTKCMKIGNWNENDNQVIQEINRIKWVNVVKLLGLYYTNDLDQTNENNWNNILNDATKKLNKFYYRQSSIFGRALLVNVFIEPKLIYPATIFDPPENLLKELRKAIRSFIFKGTLPCIKHVTLIQPKNKGGIDLHDFNLKCTSIRLKYLHQIINTPTDYPLAVYFLRDQIPNFFDNQDFDSIERVESLPSFYAEIVADWQNNETVLLNSDPKSFYKQLVNSKELNINTQVKRINELENETVNTYTIFEELHSNEFLSPTQRQLSYRIFFGLTPTSEGLAKRHNRIFPCKICSGDQETEEHIFFLCPFIQDIKLDLIKMLRQPHNTLFDIYKAIFLNKLPQQTCETILKLKILLIHVYKETIWKIRNLATHQKQIFCKRTIQTIFNGKIKWLKKHYTNCLLFQELTKEYDV